MPDCKKYEQTLNYAGVRQEGVTTSRLYTGAGQYNRYYDNEKNLYAYGNANKNPLAHMRAVNMTLENASEASDKNPAFLSNEELKPFMKVSDCSQVSDGGSAIVLVSEEGLKAIGRDASQTVEVIAGHLDGGVGYRRGVAGDRGLGAGPLATLDGVPEEEVERRLSGLVRSGGIPGGLDLAQDLGLAEDC